MAFFVGANHAGNVVTWRFHTGVLICMMNVPIICFSNKQNTVERSTFVSEFMEMHTARDIILVLR